MVCRNPSSSGRAVKPSSRSAFALDPIQLVPAISRNVSA